MAISSAAEAKALRTISRVIGSIAAIASHSFFSKKRLSYSSVVSVFGVGPIPPTPFPTRKDAVPPFLSGLEFYHIFFWGSTGLCYRFP